MKIPKTIQGHPGVEQVTLGEDEGIAEYKWHVWLRPDWQFLRGRMAGCRSGNFNSVREFQNAQPTTAGRR